MKRSAIVLFFIFLIFSGCFQLPDELVTPRVTSKFVIPVVSKNYTLKEALENDTTKIKWYKNGINTGLLYYTDSYKIDRINVGDNLKVNPFSASATKEIGPLKINKIDPLNAVLGISDVNLGLTGGTNVVFPPYSTSIEKEFPIIPNLDYAIFDDVSSEQENQLIATITNTFPVEVQLTNVTFRNVDDNSIIVTMNDLVQQTQTIVIPKSESRTVKFNLAGKKIKNQIKFDGTFTTPGSSGQIVFLESSAGLTFDLDFSNSLTIKEAKAKFPDQAPVVKTETIAIDNETAVKKAVIKSGTITTVFQNELPVQLNIEYKISSLKNNSGQSFVKNIIVPANSNSSTDITNLANWQIETTDGLIAYSFSISAVSPSGNVVVKKEDQISASINFSEIKFESFEGKIKPTEFVFEPGQMALDLGNISNSLYYNKIKLGESNLIFNLKTSANVNFALEGQLALKYLSQNITNSKQFSISIPSSSEDKVDISDLLVTENGVLPDRFEYSGKAIINPDNLQNIKVAQSDTIGGYADLEIPLNLAIKGGSFIDTVDIDINSIDDKDIEKLKKIELTLDIKNGIAAGGEFYGTMYDENFVKTIDFPSAPVILNGVSSNKITLEAAPVDAEGNVTGTSDLVEKITITGEDAKKFIHSKNLIFHFDFDTSNSSSEVAVKMKFTDVIKIKVTAKAEIEISE